MPYEIVLDHPPAGYVAEPPTGEGYVKVIVREFTSSEDGELFISRLEGIPSEIVGRLPATAGVTPSSVNHLLAVIHQNLRTVVYANECPVMAKIRAARAIQAGEVVHEDDIVDIDSLTFNGAEVPEDAAVVCVLSAGWRKGLFFDLTPLGPDHPARDYDLDRVLGSYFAYLLNQQVFKLNEAEWGLLFQQGWFPFVSLPKSVVRQLLAAVRSGRSADGHLKSVVEALHRMGPEMRKRWSEATVLRPHLRLLEHALDEFIKGDYISATSILYPRIEGILRSMHPAAGSSSSLRPPGLADAAVSPWIGTVHGYSWLLPDLFKRYLENVYFAGFAPGAEAPVSRHSVGHGVAPADGFDQKHACIALLIVDQLRFLMPVNEPANHGLEPTARSADATPGA